MASKSLPIDLVWIAPDTQTYDEVLTNAKKLMVEISKMKKELRFKGWGQEKKRNICKNCVPKCNNIIEELNKLMSNYPNWFSNSRSPKDVGKILRVLGTSSSKSKNGIVAALNLLIGKVNEYIKWQFDTSTSTIFKKFETDIFPALTSIQLNSGSGEEKKRYTTFYSESVTEYEKLIVSFKEKSPKEFLNSDANDIKKLAKIFYNKFREINNVASYLSERCEKNFGLFNDTARNLFADIKLSFIEFKRVYLNFISKINYSSTDGLGADNTKIKLFNLKQELIIFHENCFQVCPARKREDSCEYIKSNLSNLEKEILSLTKDKSNKTSEISKIDELSTMLSGIKGLFGENGLEKVRSNLQEMSSIVDNPSQIFLAKIKLRIIFKRIKPYLQAFKSIMDYIKNLKSIF